MTLNITAGTGPLTRVALAVLFGLIADGAMAQTIQGTATYRERMALPPTAVFEATIEDVSKADAPASVIASTRVPSPGQPPIAFTIAYDPARIVANNRYVVRARILIDGKLAFTSDTATPVITRGGATKVALMLRRAGGTQTGPESRGPGAKVKPTLEGTYWRATELTGKPLPKQNAKREAHLVFQAGGRVSGSDGCNRITGTYETNGDGGITFGQMAGTEMACVDSAETERAFREALERASRWRIDGNRLELLDAAGARVGVFAAGYQTAPTNSPSLQGTAWQLVKFQGGDGTTLTPDDRAKYTIEFGTEGRLSARIDCNRGRGTWKSSGSNQLQLGPLALTRAQCPPGSLHDQIVKQWSYIRSYVIKDGHLFLALMADGGTYELEPFVQPK